MKDIIFTGAAVAIVTPFTEDGINFSELKKLIDFNIENGTDAIVIAGTTGESSTMTDEEHREVIRFTVEYVNKRVPVIAGTGLMIQFMLLNYQNTLKALVQMHFY